MSIMHFYISNTKSSHVKVVDIVCFRFLMKWGVKVVNMDIA